MFLSPSASLPHSLKTPDSKELAVAADLPLSDCSHSITSFDVVSNALTDCPSLYNVSLNESYVDELRTIAFANPENYSCEVKQFRETDGKLFLSFSYMTN